MKTFKQFSAALMLIAANTVAFAQDSLRTVQDSVSTTTKTVVEHTDNHNNWWWLLLLLLPLLYFVFRKKPVNKDTYVNRDTRTDRDDNSKKY